MRFVGHHNDVATVGQYLTGLELVDERKHIPLVTAQQLTQMCSAGCVRLLAAGSQCTY